MCLNELAEEYAALFLVPGGLPPYESVRLKGLLCQEPAIEVEKFYEGCGFVLKEELISIILRREVLMDIEIESKSFDIPSHLESAVFFVVDKASRILSISEGAMEILEITDPFDCPPQSFGIFEGSIKTFSGKRETGRKYISPKTMELLLSRLIQPEHLCFDYEDESQATIPSIGVRRGKVFDEKTAANILGISRMTLWRKLGEGKSRSF